MLLNDDKQRILFLIVLFMIAISIILVSTYIQSTISETAEDKLGSKKRVSSDQNSTTNGSVTDEKARLTKCKKGASKDRINVRVKRNAQIATRKPAKVSGSRVKRVEVDPAVVAQYLELLKREQEKKNLAEAKSTTQLTCCYNGGTCFQKPGGNLSCICPPGFTGQFCHDDINECADPKVCSGPHQECKNTYGSYNCWCKEGFVQEGDDCIPETSCDDEPCYNDGECITTGEGKYKCFCKLGYTGIRCEVAVPECDDSSCAKDEECVSMPQGFKCIKLK